MPEMIYPKITGTITIEMPISQARTLSEAMATLLTAPSPTWSQKTLWDHPEGRTCDSFLRELRKVVGNA